MANRIIFIYTYIYPLPHSHKLTNHQPSKSASQSESLRSFFISFVSSQGRQKDKDWLCALQPYTHINVCLNKCNFNTYFYYCLLISVEILSIDLIY